MGILKGTLIISAIVLSGCSIAPRECDVNITHISHPTLGPPFGPRDEEGSIDSAGTRCRWIKGNLIGEMGLAYKIPQSDLYGNDFIFIGNVAYKIWEQQQ